MRPNHMCAVVVLIHLYSGFRHFRLFMIFNNSINALMTFGKYYCRYKHEVEQLIEMLEPHTVLGVHSFPIELRRLWQLSPYFVRTVYI